MTYRQLLEYIETAQRLQSAFEMARDNPKRFHGSIEEQDTYDQFFRAAYKALDCEVGT